MVWQPSAALLPAKQSSGGPRGRKLAHQVLPVSVDGVLVDPRLAVLLDGTGRKVILADAEKIG